MASGEDVKRVESGVWLSEGKTGPTRIRIRKRGRNMTRVEVTLSEGQIPSHSHEFQASGAPPGQTTPIGNFLSAKTRTQQYRSNADDGGAMHASSISRSGEDQAHENMPPFLAINFIIALEGIYPPMN